MSIEKLELEQQTLESLQGPHQLPKGVNHFGLGDHVQSNTKPMEVEHSYKREFETQKITPRI